jgi:hypothetical protein
MASAIEAAYDDRSNDWYLRENPDGIALMVGRLQALKISKRKLEVSASGPMETATCERLAADVTDSAFRALPNSLVLTVPAERAIDAAVVLQEPLGRFIEDALARVRGQVSLDLHSTEAIALVAEAVGRKLPQPVEGPDQLKAEVEGEGEDDACERQRASIVRGRAPIFTPSQQPIRSLVHGVVEKRLALPDLQRPFVWEDKRVRDLLDSLFIGFPVGTIVLWQSAEEKVGRVLGAAEGHLRAPTLVIDGQQRLMALYAVMTGKEVVGSDGERRRITIAFRPRDGRFEVADAATNSDPEFLPDVADLWGTKSRTSIMWEFLEGLRLKGRQFDGKYEEAVRENLDRASSIRDYALSVINIHQSGRMAVPDEDVAELYVRINSQGSRLARADFVLMLLSAFHPELRDKIEERSKAMSEAAVVVMGPQQILRATCAVACGRVEIGAVSRFLRGVDPSTGDASPAQREGRLKAGRGCGHLHRPNPLARLPPSRVTRGVRQPQVGCCGERRGERVRLLRSRDKDWGGACSPRGAHLQVALRHAAHRSVFVLARERLRERPWANSRG